MSIAPEPLSVPSHWQVPRDVDPVPADLLTPPRYRCSEDGTRVYTLADVAAHDAQFHAKTEAGRPEPYVDEALLRREALDQAVRVATGSETPEQLVLRAQAFEVFLRGAGRGSEQ